MQRPGFFALLLLLLLLLAPTAFADITGSIRGRVTDSDGAPLAGATVTVTSDVLVTGSRTTTTGDTGDFRFVALPPGAYQVEVQRMDFRTATIEGVRVKISTATPVEVALAPSFADEVTVSAAPLVNRTTASFDSSYTEEQLEYLPQRRYFWESLNLAPGISSTFEDNTPALIAYGSGVTSSSWQIDGVNTNSPGLGAAWWYINPDTIAEVQVLGVGAPAEYGNLLGAAFNIVTQSGGNDLAGRLNFYYQDDALTDSNVTLEGNPFPEYHRETFRDLTGSLGGPILEDRLWFFLAGQTTRDSAAEPGFDPALLPVDELERYDVKLSSALNPSTTLDFKFHYEDFLEPEGGSPFKAPEAFFDFSGTNPAWGLNFTSVLTDATFLEIGYSGWTGDLNKKSRTGSTEPAFIDRSPPGGGPPVQTGGITFPFTFDNSRDEVEVIASHFADELLAGDHDFRFGVQYSIGESRGEFAPGPEGAYYSRYVYNGTAYYYKYFSNPYRYGSDAESLSGFVDDSWRINDHWTVTAGLRYDDQKGSIPDFERLAADFSPTGEIIPGIDGVVQWNTISPRLGIAYSPDPKTVIRGSFGVYYDALVTNNWDFPPPEAPPFEIFLQNPATGEYDILLASFANDAATIDPDLEAPRALQYSVGFDRQLGARASVGAQVIYKETDNLVGWQILDDGVYEAVPWINPVTGEHETLLSILTPPTVIKGNRPGFTVLGPDTKYYQEYLGVVLTFEKRFDRGWLSASYTWSESEGIIPRQFSSFQNNALFTFRNGTDPNHWLNADQLLQGDRRHMLRLQGAWRLPWQLEANANINLQSGRPYSQQFRVRLNQGSVLVTGVPGSDDQRYDFQEIVNVGLGRRFPLGPVDLRIDAQILNLLNDDAIDRWATLQVNPGDEFVPRSWVAPRRVMLRFGLEF